MLQTLSARQHAARLPSRLAVQAAGGTVNFTTPSGVLASVDSSSTGGEWEKILLGQVVTPDLGELALISPVLNYSRRSD
ncbi:hypothetical protein [Pectobacterium brasiliense]|uniref:hypothetical protein n=1 Tax=Pectobacterium brasiliense TaxID=180957 RepID=UPI0019698649|nr:hypothetical protein [Pectobacterium brasiliense]MBN3121893.1 hypothetical protein [Pectobacterium brasiliense]